MLKRTLSVLFILLVIFLFCTSNIFAYNENLLESKYKEEKLLEENSGEKNYIIDNDLIEKQYEQRMLLEDTYEKKVSDILYYYTKNLNLSKKATSIEKEDKTLAIKECIKILQNETVSKNNILLLNYYISKYSRYLDDSTISAYTDSMNYSTSIYSTASSSYDRTAAYTYAINNYNKYNTNYPNVTYLGGDCTNFVSQAMHEGLDYFIMAGSGANWYIYKKNSTYMTPTNITQLNYSWDLSDPSPWISASVFETFFSSRYSNETFTSSYVYNNKSIIYNKPYYRGDVIQILKKRYWWYEGYHTMMITSYASGDFRLTYHTNNTLDNPLNTIAKNYNTTDYKFKFYSVVK